jgi:hypothetical protein
MRRRLLANSPLGRQMVRRARGQLPLLLASSQPGRQMVLHAESPLVVHAAQIEHLHEGAAGPHDDAGLVLFFLDKTPHSRHMGILHHVQLPAGIQNKLRSALSLYSLIFAT